MRGAQVVDVGAEDLEGARAALARAVATGALGPAQAVRRDGDGFAFDDGRIDVVGDGRVTWELSLRRLQRGRLAEAIVVATFVSVAATLGFSLAIYASLPSGAVAGAAYAIARVVADRGAARRRVRALVASLPVLVDTRRE
jgi:hypothetical protein